MRERLLVHVRGLPQIVEGWNRPEDADAQPSQFARSLTKVTFSIGNWSWTIVITWPWASAFSTLLFTVWKNTAYFLLAVEEVKKKYVWSSEENKFFLAIWSCSFWLYTFTHTQDTKVTCFYHFIIPSMKVWDDNLISVEAMLCIWQLPLLSTPVNGWSMKREGQKIEKLPLISGSVHRVK